MASRTLVWLVPVLLGGVLLAGPSLAMAPPCGTTGKKPCNDDCTVDEFVFGCHPGTCADGYVLDNKGLCTLAPQPDLGCGQLGQAACRSSEPGYVTNAGNACDTGLTAQGSGSGQLCINSTRSSSYVDSLQEGHTLQTLQAQRRLAFDLPVNEVTFLGAHNSYNTYADGYAPAVTNQIYSMTDQLRSGMRWVLLDLHWVRGSTNWLFGNTLDAIKLCHSSSPRMFCSTQDRVFSRGLQEIASWMSTHRTEVVLFELEDDKLQNNGLNAAGKPIFFPVNVAITPIEQLLGGVPRNSVIDALRQGEDAIFRPVDLSNAGDRWPSLGELRVLGKRAVIFSRKFRKRSQTGSRGFFDGRTGHTYLPQKLSETYIGRFVPSPCGYRNNSGTTIRFDPATKGNALWSFIEDRTFSMDWIEPGKVEQMSACGVNLIGMDKVLGTVSGVGRLSAALFSWAEGQPSGTGRRCAYLKDGRWWAADCAGSRRVACQDNTDSNSWSLSTGAVTWAGAATACPAGSSFAAPANGLQAAALKQAVSTAETWLNYTNLDGAGDWVSVAGTYRLQETASGNFVTVDTDGNVSLGPTGTVLTLTHQGRSCLDDGSHTRLRADTGRYLGIDGQAPAFIVAARTADWYDDVTSNFTLHFTSGGCATSGTEVTLSLGSNAWAADTRNNRLLLGLPGGARTTLRLVAP